jgi:dephospho-CoA kinase
VGEKTKKIIGLVGGMCSGKTTAAKEFANLGCAVINADEIAHQLLEEKDVFSKIIKLFGKEILNEQGKIDRHLLANFVFGDPAKLSKLTGVLHPKVMVKVEELLALYEKDSAVKAIVLDIPLLIEVGWEKRCDYVIFVDCKPQIRLERAKKMGVFDVDQLKIRENLQISLDKKKLIADNVIDNNSGLSGLSKQIACLFSSIIEKR